jgi:hypothetical protein
MFPYPISLAIALSMADGTIHGSPVYELSVAEAHAEMRTHVACRAWRCPCKAAALAVLVESGRIRPDYDRYDG